MAMNGPLPHPPGEGGTTMEAHFIRRGFLPEEDPLGRFGDHSEFAALDTLGHDLPSLLHDRGFRKYAREQRIPATRSGTSPTGAPALLRAPRLPGLGLRQPGRRGAGDVAPRQPRGPPLRRLCPVRRPPILSYDGYALYNWRASTRAARSPGQHRHDPGLRPPLRRALVHPGARPDRGPGGGPAGGHRPGRGGPVAGRPLRHRCRHGRDRPDDLGPGRGVGRIPEKMDPALYYRTFRPYIRFFEGVVYEGVDAAPLDFRGETGAQSSVVPTLVAFLKIPHRPSRF